MGKKIGVILLAVLFVGTMIFAVGCGGGNEGGSNDETKILKVGMEATYAPFEYEDEDGVIVGFDADLIRAIGEEMGYETQLSYVEWDGLDPALNSGQLDVVISAVSITPGRQLEADFSEPYFEATQIIAVREDSSISGLADLADLTVGVQVNTTGQYVLEDAGLADEQIVKYPTAPDAMMNLANGSLDAVVADAPVILNYIVNNPEMAFKTVDDNFEKEYYGIKVRKGNTELLADIDEGLKRVKENGTFDQIHSKYFGE